MSQDDEKKVPQSPDLPDPVTYMRNLHPDLYSDSNTVTSVELPQILLEYHLDTLTNRNQETEFAYFARRLAEKEICPNLRPQTGPTGGGDSKADSETFPVSGEISELWVGSDPKAGQERWAFAFSAKKTWKSKVAADVRNIASTKRGYSRIYFITNQFAPDKSRAESEDSLTKETGIKVTILDRSWISKAVKENGRADIAIEALKIEELRSLVEKNIGPADLERQQELEELEKAITDPDRYRGARYQLIEDALRAAILARGLGRPRTEIDGLFLRADRLASDPEQPRQRLRVVYNYAWTVVFWFNDYRLLNSLYDTVEGYALKSDQMEEVELVQNLWTVLMTQVERGVISKSDAKLESRREALDTILGRLAAESTRPNNALRARTSLALLAVQDAVRSPKPADALNEVVRTFSQIVADAENLGDYPFERLPKFIDVLGEIGIESDDFDALFESVVGSLEKRRGEVTGARLLQDRGFKKLEANKPYEAISLLGRAMERLVKREHRNELIFCMMGLSEAYVAAGLLWAARSCALAAAERCLASFREEGKLIRPSLLALEQLVVVETRLGRLAHVLMGIELENLLGPQLALTEDQRAAFVRHRDLTEMMLGIALLSASLDQLRQMDCLPEALEGLGLSIAKPFLLYALGHRDELRNEGYPEEKWSNEAIDDFVKQAFEQPGRLQMPDRPQIEDGGSITYQSSVLGCQIKLQAPATRTSISVSEAVLGTIESFFATSLNERIMPYRPAARIVVQPTDELIEGLRVTEETIDGDTFINVRHPSVVPPFTAAARTKYRDSLMTLIASFIAHVAVVDDFASYLDRIADEERGFARALLYSEVSLAQDNIFGSSPKVLLRDWSPTDCAKRFPLARSVEWHEGISIEQAPLPDDEGKPTFDSNNPLASFREKASSERHRDRKVASLIDIPLWNEAGWVGALYFADPSKAPHPVLCLGFSNKEAAAKIFQGWQKQFGAEDKNNRLRISVLRGISRSHPAWYRVVVGTNISPSEEKNSIIVTAIKPKTMMPETPENLDRFLKSVEQAGRYLLAPAHMVSATQVPTIDFDLTILKTELIVRNAWEVPVNDLDSPAFAEEDDPVVPPDVEDAPVTALLAAIRERNKKKRGG